MTFLLEQDAEEYGDELEKHHLQDRSLMDQFASNGQPLNMMASDAPNYL